MATMVTKEDEVILTKEEKAIIKEAITCKHDGQEDREDKFGVVLDRAGSVYGDVLA